MRKRFIGYVRVSTDQQAEGGVSLADQRRRLDALAVANDVDLLTIHEDAGVSAKSLDRPGLRAALADLDSGFADGIMITKLDRLTRSVRDLGDLLDKYFTERFALVSLGDSLDTRSAAGRMMLNILVSVGQWEREAACERTRSALGHLKASGVRLGPIPFGLKHGGLDENGRREIVADPVTAATAARARALRADGKSLREIAATLSFEGHATRRGGLWNPGSVQSMLRTAV